MIWLGFSASLVYSGPVEIQQPGKTCSLEVITIWIGFCILMVAPLSTRRLGGSLPAVYTGEEQKWALLLPFDKTMSQPWIEHGARAWQARILPLNHCDFDKAAGDCWV
jgi:hypothetical protein